jgi:parallel beta-helix repeat protein
MGLSQRFLRNAAVFATSAVVVGSASGAALAHGNAHHKSHPGHGKKSALYVSPSGKSGASDHNCSSAAYSTVQSAVDAVPSGGTVVVCRGTFTEDVIVSKSLTLSGQHGAVIHGSSTANGNCDQLGAKGPGSSPCLAGVTVKSSHVRIQGLKVTGATGEGILATGSLAGGSISHVTIEHDTVVGNDLGGIPPTTSTAYFQCVGFGAAPGDCGEGIHLMGATNSTVSHNFVSGNSGGVLLTDEFGPTAHNVISHNVVTKNQYDCGVTLPGHNPFAVSTSGALQPSKAGVYDNVIAFNRVTDNGLKGDGAGVLFANASAGTGSYNNLVEHNYIAGNGLSGVTMHAHTVTPGQFEDLSGNRIVHNTFGKNNIDGDTLDSPASPEDNATTAILVFSGTVPVTVDIAHNRIRNNTNGVWLGTGGHVTAKMSHNVFQHVTNKVVTVP